LECLLELLKMTKSVSIDQFLIKRPTMEPTQHFSDPSAANPQFQVPAVAHHDLLKILIRWKWLPLLGAIVGGTVGFLMHGQMPQKWKAIAQVRVESPAREVPISNSLTSTESKPSLDELTVVQSSKVLEEAVKKGQLTSHRRLLGKSQEQIVAMMKKKGFLDVRLGSKDLNSNIIQIGVITDDKYLSGDIAQAIVNGYEEFVTGNIKNYTKEALAALTKFRDEYERNRMAASGEIARLNSNPNLILKDGKPHDPVSDTVLGLMDKTRKLDDQSRNVEALLKQVQEGQSAGRSLESLLKLISIYTDTIESKETSELSLHKATMQNQQNLLDQFEQEKVIPARSDLSFLQEQHLGDSHPRVIAAGSRLARLEDELSRRRERNKQYETENRPAEADLPTLEGRLSISIGALKESRQAMAFEKEDCLTQIESLRERLQENSTAISKYALSVAELAAVSEISTQIGENLRKLSLASEYGQKTVTRLELPTLGTFDGPFWYQYIGIGGFLGLLVFSGLAYLLEMADRSYRNPGEIASDLGVPIIGHLPLATISRSERIDDKVDSSIVTLHKSKAPISEAFRGIRTGLFFSCQKGNVKVIQVTSPVPGDGKSTVAANIAVSIAQSGRSVCLVDCDFRRPRVAKMFGLLEEVGFVQVINGKSDLENAIQQTSIDNLSSLTCGKRPSNPAELLSSDVFSDILAQLRAKFDFVIIDTPPMLAVSDPANVARLVDGVLLTIRLRRNLRPIATRASQMLHALNANMLGVVVNGIGVGGTAYGYGGYRYDNYDGGSGGGYGKSGYGGYGYGSTFQYGGYYGTKVGSRDEFDDSIPMSNSKRQEPVEIQS
jgi:polysaccharide biosynthesis transport protein